MEGAPHGQDDALRRSRHVLEEGLHVCPRCCSSLVQPVDWKQLKVDWSLALRCPECDLTRTGVWSERQLARLQAVQAHASASMLHDCEAMERERLQAGG